MLLSPQGEELQRFSLSDVIARSKYRDVLRDWFSGEDWDLLHTNNLEVIGDEFASHHSFAEPGQLLVSFRSLDAIGLVDVESQELVWAQQGFWDDQHDPDPLSNGDILIYDNLGHEGEGGRSQIVAYDPLTGERSWAYAGTEESPFYSRWGGKQSALPNGNVLISEPLGGRLVEVSSDGRVVWEFYNPKVQKSDGDWYRAIVHGGAQRVEPSKLSFTPDALRSQ